MTNGDSIFVLKLYWYWITTSWNIKGERIQIDTIRKKIPPKSSILVLIVSQSGLFVPFCFWLLLRFHIFNKRCWTYLIFAGVPSFKSIIPVLHEFSCLIFAQGEVNMSSCLKPSSIKLELLNLQYYPYFILVPSLDMSIFENALTTFYLTFYFYILILTIWPK